MKQISNQINQRAEIMHEAHQKSETEETLRKKLWSPVSFEISDLINRKIMQFSPLFEYRFDYRFDYYWINQ